MSSASQRRVRDRSDGAGRRPYAWLVAVVLLCVYLSSFASAGADELYVSRATRQKRTGGPAGRAAMVYTILLVSQHAPEKLRIDGMWIEGRYVAFAPDETRPYHLPANVVPSAKDGTVEYRITYAVDRSVSLDPRDEPMRTAARPQPTPPLSAEGVLAVHVDGAERYVPIARFESSPAVSLP